jgi:hypothetical protein
MIPVAVAAAAATALTLAGTSLAASSGPNSAGPDGAGLSSAGTSPAAVRPAVSSRSLCTSLWAVVNINGTLARAGCPGTTSAVSAGGGYQVLFPRDVRGCAYLATVGTSGARGLPADGTATVTGLGYSADGVYVATYDPAAAFVNEPFHLSVTCAPAQRAGQVTIYWPHTSKTISVPGGVSASTVIVATPRNDTGAAVVAAVPHTAVGTATIYLSRAPSKGHPVLVGWIAGN